MHSAWADCLHRSRNRIFVLSAFLFVVVYMLYKNTDSPNGTEITALKRMLDFQPNPVFGHRIVHLDLKGAPPRPSFYEGFFPMLKEVGITAVLMEYEDMFPYWGNLSILPIKKAYNNETIARILRLAKENSLEIIPLVQTFGHLEFALKHPQFNQLREVPEKADTICPSDNRSIELIQEMLVQVRQLHPEAKSIHIGADEAWHIAKDARCFNKLHMVFNNSEDRLKLAHISSVANYAKEVLKFDKVYAWNDMFSSIDAELMKEYDLGKLLVPVVWGYAPDVTIDGYFPHGMFERYSKVFPELQFASAFKGANGINETFLNIDRYFLNLFSYHRLLAMFQHDLKNRVTGMVLTGWQRYFHGAQLCELLPVGMPSLINEALYELDPSVSHAEQKNRLLKFLNCQTLHPISPIYYHGHVYNPPNEAIFGHCHYLGVDAFREIENLRFLKWKIWVDGILTAETRMELESLNNRLKIILLKYYYEDTVDEWINQNLNPETIVPTTPTPQLMHITSS